MSSTFDQASTADGSASLTQGLTSVTAAVHGPRDGRSAPTRPPMDQAGLNVSVQVAPFAASDRRKRSKADRCVSTISHSLVCFVLIGAQESD